MSFLPSASLITYRERTWWHRGRPYSPEELIWDGAVHGLGLIITVTLGGALLTIGGLNTAQNELPTLVVYVGSLLMVMSVSWAFNLAPVSPLKRFLARLDQAAIFLLIAGTYTPLLTLVSDTTLANVLLAVVWGGALVGMALKLLIPERFGRLGLLLYLAVGFSGVVVFNSLAEAFPPGTILLVAAGGVAYSSGIIFHLWERLRFHNVLWHCFVVLGATLHLWAIVHCMVVSRL